MEIKMVNCCIYNLGNFQSSEQMLKITSSEAMNKYFKCDSYVLNQTKKLNNKINDRFAHPLV